LVSNIVSAQPTEAVNKRALFSTHIPFKRHSG
jgi:hypothetical protein